MLRKIQTILSLRDVPQGFDRCIQNDYVRHSVNAVAGQVIMVFVITDQVEPAV